MRILICGDSFSITDTRYPGLHWSEKIGSRGHDIVNVALGGGTNGQIVAQLHQGLRLNPDFVIIGFTSINRAVYDKVLDHRISSVMTDADIRNFNLSRYETSCYDNQIKNEFYHRYLTVASEEFEIIETYFKMIAMFDHLKIRNIPFCWNLGGLADLDIGSILEKNFLVNLLIHQEHNRTKINLWKHAQHGETVPWFHVPDESVLKEFSDECLFHIEKNNQWA